ncbi:MAG: SpoIIE family protein phosphatase [candidate division KSB1 bacterium]|nr:SpoIIE family protein phosphatase [candidate division KSB1 bacterium]MDZ7301420.1 SpoIIE family protein phosphatase [candidate division KSB1 bacterium]MDZ7313453.1 SpoIIE family protein phosphatase [candidate division KSB1 bacterium]
MPTTKTAKSTTLSLPPAEAQREIAALRNKVANLSSLIEVSIIVNSTLDLDSVLSLVMEKALAVMDAEASSVMLINEKTGMLEWEVALGEVGEQVKEKIQLRVGEGIAGWVAQSGQPLIVPDVSKEPRFSKRSDEATGFKTRSILAVPLKVKDRIIGVAEVINPVRGKFFTEDDLELFSTFSRQVALAIENARMHRAMLEKQKLDQQLEAARTIQESFMPQTFPEDAQGRFEVFAKSIPATQIGGDFFDFLRFDDDTLGIVVGDVSGKGVPAALYMARLVSDFRVTSQRYRDPVQTLRKMNEILVERGRRGMFVTLQYAQLNVATGMVHFATGGHLPACWLKSDGSAAEFISSGGGAPLGITPETQFLPKSLQLAPGDYLVSFTDGIVEAKSLEMELYTMPRLKTFLCRKWASPKELVEGVVEDVRKFTQGMPQQDDLTVVALKWTKP